MRNRRILSTALVLAAFGLVWVAWLTAQEKPKYVGPEVCSTCHADVYKRWQFTSHRRTLFNTDPAKKGCEACHGPGGDHVAAGGDPKSSDS